MKGTLFLCMLLTPLHLFSQEEKVLSSSSAAVRYYREAQIKVNVQSFELATDLLNKAIQADAHFAEAYQVLGDIQRKQKKFPEAEKTYLFVVKLHPSFLSQTWLGLGISQFNQMEYAAATSCFKNYLDIGQGSDEMIGQVKKLLDNCHFSIAAMASPKPFNPQNLGPRINTGADEYLPSVTVDDSTLIFTRRLNNNEDFYVSARTEKGWSLALPLDEHINTPEYNEGAGSISADGNDLYYTLCGRPGVIGRCDIYVSHRQENRWTEPRNLGPEVNTEGWESQPSISGNGRTLYFTSSRPGGYGGFDIWKTEKLPKGHWAKPVNLGPEINTTGNEISPFIHPDDETLYFSSDGLPGMGGKDLFYSRRGEGGKWSVPVNLGYPINTAGDESTLVITASGRKGYFASDKISGFGGFDLYSFDLYKEARPVDVSYIKGNILDEETRHHLDAQVDIVRLTDGKVMYSAYSDKLTGDFLAGLPGGFEYAFNVSRQGYLFYSENLSLKGALPRVYHRIDIALRHIAAGKKDVLNNVFFDTDLAVLKPESKIELERLAQFLKLNPGVNLEVSGHTDNEGSSEHNMILSGNRARSVVLYLVKTGQISSGRLTYRGYGKTQPLAPNTTERGKALNRRTEFKILSIQK